MQDAEARLSFVEASEDCSALVVGLVGLAQLMQASVRDSTLGLVTHQARAVLVH